MQNKNPGMIYIVGVNMKRIYYIVQNVFFLLFETNMLFIFSFKTYSAEIFVYNYYKYILHLRYKCLINCRNIFTNIKSLILIFFKCIFSLCDVIKLQKSCLIYFIYFKNTYSRRAFLRGGSESALPCLLIVPK